MVGPSQGPSQPGQPGQPGGPQQQGILMSQTNPMAMGGGQVVTMGQPQGQQTTGPGQPSPAQMSVLQQVHIKISFFLIDKSTIYF